jgi:hypothetical protein
LAHRSEYSALFTGDKGNSNPEQFLKYLEDEAKSNAKAA